MAFMASSIIDLFLLVATCSVLTGSARALTYVDCGLPGGLADAKNVTMIPDPAVSGEQMTFNIAATTTKEITGGSVIVLVQFRGIPIHIERDPLCGKTKCPIAAGEDFLFENSQPLPTVTPAGPYVVRITALNQNSELLFCEKMSFQIVKPSTASSWSEAISGAVRSLLRGGREDAGAVMEAAEKVWNLPGDAKVSLRRALAGLKEWEVGAGRLENYAEMRRE